MSEQNGDAARPELPEGWEWVAVGDIATVIRGVGYKKDEVADAPRDGYLPLLRSGNIQARLETDHELVYVPLRLVREDQRLVKGDLVVSVSNSKELVGKAALLRYDWSGTFGAFLGVVRRTSDRVLPEYLSYFFSSPSYRRRIAELSAATSNIANIRKAHLLELPLPLPPLDEQERIVARVSASIERISAAEAELANGARLLRALPGATVRRSIEDVDAPPVQLGDVVEVLDRLRVPVNRKERAEREGSVPYYGATGRVGWIDDYLFDEELVLLGEDGVPFLDPQRPKAYVVRGKSWVNNHAHVLRPSRDVVRADYLRRALDCVDYSQLVGGTTRLKLTKSAMLRISLPLPSLDEQDRIVSAVSRQLAQADDLASAVRDSERRSGALRRALLQRVFAGSL